MTTDQPDRPAQHRTSTEIVHAGRHPFDHFGFVNPPVYRGSTVLFPDLATLQSGKQRYTYGRRGSPTMSALEEALCRLDGGHRTVLAPSGMGAISTVLLALVKTGDHILMVDTVYRPTRHFCDGMLAGFGVETTYYDPLVGGDIARLIRPNTRLVYVESPGSQTFEIQDIPAIAAAAHARDLWVVMDNTWATPLLFKPLEHGVDVAIQAATKYIVGHADAMLGVITCNERATPAVTKALWGLGTCAGTEEIYLGLRGLRTMEVRLERHHRAGLEMARWLAGRPEIARVLHPGLPEFQGHALWKRDFKGASGLFSVELKPVAQPALAAMMDGLELFGMGWSWGGYESLVVPFDASEYRSAPKPPAGTLGLRFHIGLEDTEDLKTDLERGFARMAAAAR